jgi:Mce-associated membrane protein
MSTGSQQERGIARTIVIIAVVLVVIALGFAGWFGVSWYSAATDDSNTYSQTREEVRAIGSSAISTLTTLDYQNVDAGLDQWQEVSTGVVHDEFVKNRETNKGAIQNAKTKTTAKVLETAVTDLNTQQKTAKIIAAVEATVTQEGQQPGTKRMRLEAVLTETDEGWKVSEIRPVSFEQPK